MTDPIVLAAADWIHASECDCKEGPHTSHIAVAVDIISEVKPLIRAQIADQIQTLDNSVSGAVMARAIINILRGGQQ